VGRRDICPSLEAWEGRGNFSRHQGKGREENLKGVQGRGNMRNGGSSYVGNELEECPVRGGSEPRGKGGEMLENPEEGTKGTHLPRKTACAS